MVAAPSPDRIREYLLRQMPEAERATFEQAYFDDDRLLDRVEAEEDRLVSDYVLGRLSQSDRQRFEGSLLDSPYYRDRVETTSRLRTRVATTWSEKIRTTQESRLFPERTGTFVLFSLMATLLVASLLSAVRLRSQLREALARPLPRTEAPAAPITVLLDAALTSGPEVRSVRRAGTGRPVLLVMPGVTGRYRARLLDASGQPAWDSGPREAEPVNGAESVTLPAGQPRAGWYTVRITSEPAGEPLRTAFLDVSDAR